MRSNRSTCRRLQKPRASSRPFRLRRTRVRLPPGMTVGPSPFNAAPAGVAPPPPPVAPAPPAASAVPTAVPAPPPAAGSPGGPKKVHTVTIRADQQAGPDAGSAPPAPAHSAATRAAAPAPRLRTPAGTNQPLSLVPGAQGDAPAPAPAPLPRPAAAPTAIATAAPAATPEAAPASGSGYAVQVTSQRSEADAQAAFRALRAKFPNQLGGREPIVRRTDLGAKGTYYRALVGPFASAEEAAGVCSSLKTAGGSCLVQRN